MTADRAAGRGAVSAVALKLPDTSPPEIPAEGTPEIPAGGTLEIPAGCKAASRRLAHGDASALDTTLLGTMIGMSPPAVLVASACEW